MFHRVGLESKKCLRECRVDKLGCSVEWSTLKSGWWWDPWNRDVPLIRNLYFLVY